MEISKENTTEEYPKEIMGINKVTMVGDLNKENSGNQQGDNGRGSQKENVGNEQGNNGRGSQQENRGHQQGNEKKNQ